MKQVLANELIRKLKVFFKKQNRLWNRYFDMGDMTEYIILEKRDADHVEMRTDATAYDMFYDPTMSEDPSFFDEYHTRFYDFIEKLGWRAEAEGGGILTLFREM